MEPSQRPCLTAKPSQKPNLTSEDGKHPCPAKNLIASVTYSQILPISPKVGLIGEDLSLQSKPLNAGRSDCFLKCSETNIRI
jgi:hypothetical protein